MLEDSYGRGATTSAIMSFGIMTVSITIKNATFSIAVSLCCVIYDECRVLMSYMLCHLCSVSCFNINSPVAVYPHSCRAECHGAAVGQWQNNGDMVQSSGVRIQARRMKNSEKSFCFN